MKFGKAEMTREYCKIRPSLALMLIIVLGVSGILVGLAVDAEDIDPEDEPKIDHLEPDIVERGRTFKIIGHNFGVSQEDGQVRIGSKAQAESPELGQGRVQSKIRLWENEKIKVKLTVPSTWEDEIRYVWVENDTKKSPTYQALGILPREDALILDAVYPTLHKWVDPDLCPEPDPCSKPEHCPDHCTEVELIGTGFDEHTRVSMYLDSGHRRDIVGSEDTDFARAVAVSGDYAYVADGGAGLQVINISNPENPYWVASEDTYSARAVAILGDYAYVADGGAGLQVINISNPENMRKSPPVDTPGDAEGVAVSGDYAYVADWGIGLPDTGLQVIDISNPENPYWVKSVYIPGGHARDVAVSNDHAYVAASFVFQVINISTPETPYPVSSVDTPYGAQGVVVLGDYAYVANYGAGLQIIDISTPEDPHIVGAIQTPGNAMGVVVSGDYAYVADGFSGLQVIDVSTPPIMHAVGFVDTPSGARGVVVSGDYAYVADYWAGLYVIDISPPEDSHTVKSVSPGYGQDLAVSGDYAYMANRSFGLQVIDISPPEDSHTVASVNTLFDDVVIDDAVAVAVSGDYAYVADRIVGLHVINISKPETPSWVGSEYYTPALASGVAVSGKYAYVSDWDAGLYVINISTPEDPDIVTPPIHTPGRAADVVVSGGYAYVADDWAGLQVIDISTPDESHIVGHEDTPGFARGVSISGDYAYVAADQKGIYVIDISTPENPHVVASIDTPSSAGGVAVSGDYVYAADEPFGLAILPVPAVIVPDPNSISENNICLKLPNPLIPGHYSLRVFDGTEGDELLGALSFLEDASDARVIIVVGGEPGNSIWKETTKCANKAYDVLVYQGYRDSKVISDWSCLSDDEDHIEYLTNEDNSRGDRASTWDNLYDTIISTWAAEATELLIYLVDHGGTDTFEIDPNDPAPDKRNLNATTLDQWLDSYQESTGTPVTVVYDACQSGSFISKLRPPDGYERIVITGSSEEDAVFLSQGQDSFSYHFWELLRTNGGSLLDAFLDAKSRMAVYQTAQVEADGDWIHNEPIDEKRLAGKVIRRGASPRYLKARPFVGQVTVLPEKLSPNGETEVIIEARGVNGTRRVWAQIVPPDYDSVTSDLPVSALREVTKVKLYASGEPGIYTGTYNNFPLKGTYPIIVKAIRSENVYSFVSGEEETIKIYSEPKYAFVTQLLGSDNREPSPDDYEEDDILEQASIMVLNDELQRHNFDSEGDVDWVKFYAIKGVTYTVKASDLSMVCDVGIMLRDAAGNEFTAPEPPEGRDEWLDWKCKNEGVCYVKVTNENKNFGENTRYSLTVYQPTAPSLSVRVHGVVNDCNTGKPIEANIKTNGGISALSAKNGSYLMPHMEGGFTFTVHKEGYTTCVCPGILVGQGLTVNFQLSALGAPPCQNPCDTQINAAETSGSGGRSGGGGGSGVG